MTASARKITEAAFPRTKNGPITAHRTPRPGLRAHLWCAKAVQGIQHPPYRVAVAPDARGQLAVAPGACGTTGACRQAGGTDAGLSVVPSRGRKRAKPSGVARATLCKSLPSLAELEAKKPAHRSTRLGGQEIQRQAACARQAGTLPVPTAFSPAPPSP